MLFCFFNYQDQFTNATYGVNVVQVPMENVRLARPNLKITDILRDIISADFVSDDSNYYCPISQKFGTEYC